MENMTEAVTGMIQHTLHTKGAHILQHLCQGDDGDYQTRREKVALMQDLGLSRGACSRITVSKRHTLSTCQGSGVAAEEPEQARTGSVLPR